MKRFVASKTSSLLLAVPLLASGCASLPEQSEAPMSLPAATPFDQNTMERAAYLEGYRDGYRSASGAGGGSVDVIHGPHRFARELGWRAGAADARASMSKPAR